MASNDNLNVSPYYNCLPAPAYPYWSVIPPRPQGHWEWVTTLPPYPSYPHQSYPHNPNPQIVWC